MPYNGLNKGTYTGLANGNNSGTFSGTISGLQSPTQKTYEAETIAWVKQLSSPKPSPEYLVAIDTLIMSLKMAGIWDQLDRLWIFATEQRSHAKVTLINPNGI